MVSPKTIPRLLQSDRLSSTYCLILMVVQATPQMLPTSPTPGGLEDSLGVLNKSLSRRERQSATKLEI
ncbi:MAG: hypothetical protein AB1589_16640 [Cyanobacteriota bacterium]